MDERSHPGPRNLNLAFILGYSSVTAGLGNDSLIGLAVAALAWARVAQPVEREDANGA